MNYPNSHIYLVGYLNGQMMALMATLDLIERLRTSYPDDQEVQLVLDRRQTETEEEIQSIEEMLFEIPRSN